MYSTSITGAVPPCVVRAQRAPCGAAPAASGLVNTSTSHTLVMYPAEMRLVRLRKSVITYAECVQEHFQRERIKYKCAFITLTYRPDVKWSRSHIAACMTLVRNWASRRGIVLPYIWVAELTAKGVVHYHAMFWLPRGYTLPLFDKQGWWPHGMSNAKWARRPVGYLAKYASKGTGDGRGTFPKHCRLHGCGAAPLDARLAWRYRKLPKWLRDKCPDQQIFRRAPSGWIQTDTGEFFRTPWRLVSRTPFWFSLTFERIPDQEEGET